MFIKASNRIENTVENKKNYNGIDLIKFICAFLICSIHTLSVEGTSFSDNLGFYFKTTAFLLFRKQSGNMPIENDCIKKRVLSYLDFGEFGRFF